MVQQREVVLRRLAEADARIDPDLAHPGGAGPGRPLQHEAVHLGHHVAVAGVGLHGAGLALHVHGHPAGAGLRRHLPQRGRDVVDQRGPGADGRPGHRGLGGVDRDTRAGGGQRLDHRHHPGQLLVEGHRGGPGAGGLAPDVDHVGPLGGQLEAVGHGALGGGVEAAVGEGVGRHVEHPHDERPPRSHRHRVSGPG